MTSYMYTLELNDTEAIMLIAALKMMLSHCEQKLSAGEKIPFTAWQRSAGVVLSKVYGGAELASFSSWPE